MKAAIREKLNESYENKTGKQVKEQEKAPKVDPGGVEEKEESGRVDLGLLDPDDIFFSRDADGRPKPIEVDFIGHPEIEGSIKIIPFEAGEQYRYMSERARFRERVEQGEFESVVVEEAQKNDEEDTTFLYNENDEIVGFNSIPLDLILKQFRNHIVQPDLSGLTKKELLGMNDWMITALWMTLQFYGKKINPNSKNEPQKADESAEDIKKK